MSAILRATLSVSAATVLSRATGYLRVAALVAFLGTGVVAQAYTVSLALPGLIYELFLGGILYSIFIPILVDRRTSHGDDDARRLTNALFTIVLPALLAVTVVAVVFAGPLVRLATNWTAADQFAQLSPEDARRTTELAILMFRIFALKTLFYGVVTIGTGILQAHRRFFLPTFAPVLHNLTVIASFVGFALIEPRDPELAVYVLAAGTTLGVVVMALALVPTMLRLGYGFRPQLGHPALASTARLAAPMVVMVAASVVFQFYTYYLGTTFNAATELLAAFTVFSLPFGVFTTAIATTLMPELSERHSRGDLEGYRENLSFGLRVMAFLMVPSTVGLVALATPAIGLLYERGRFDAADTRLVAALLAAHAVGLLGYSAYFMFVRAFYSRQNTLTPALMNVGLTALYAALAYGISRLMDSIVGVGLALSLAYAAFAVVGLAITRRDIKRVEGRRLAASLARMLPAGAVMYAVAAGGTALLGPGSGTLEYLLILTAVGTVSLASYLGAAYLFRVEELRSAYTLLRRK